MINLKDKEERAALRRNLVSNAVCYLFGNQTAVDMLDAIEQAEARDEHTKKELELARQAITRVQNEADAKARVYNENERTWMDALQRRSAELTSAEKSLTTYKVLHANQAKTIGEHECTISKLGEEMRQMRSYLDSLRKENADLVDQRETASQTVSKLTRTVGEARAAIASLQDERNSFKMKRDGALNKIAALEGDWKALCEDRRKVRDELNQERNERIRQGKLHEECARDNDRLVAQRDAMRESLDEERSAKSKLARQFDELELVDKSIIAQAEAERQNHQITRKELDEMKSTILNFRRMLARVG